MVPIRQQKSSEKSHKMYNTTVPHATPAISADDRMVLFSQETAPSTPLIQVRISPLIITEKDSAMCSHTTSADDTPTVGLYPLNWLRVWPW